MLQTLKKDVYLLLHKKIFLIMLIILTLLFSYISLRDITDVYTKGYSYQHHFIIGSDYLKISFKNGLFNLIPLLVVFPFADTWLSERNMTDVVFTRVNKKNFFTSKYLICFLSGFLLLFIPLLISFLSEILMLDLHTNQMTMFTYIAAENNFKELESTFTFYQLYATHPYIYILVFFAIVSTYGGLCAMLAFSISLICKQKVLTYIAVFFLSFIPNILFSFLNDPYGKWYFQALISPYNTNAKLSVWVYFVFLLMFLLIDFVLFKIYARRDPFE
ncbi:hypothetical protein [Absiella sp. AM29-15]|uniref:hypothetical protein n=1 Tax=Absiella sp. AM29-15 TaxID=2292278 RepID=UPI000E42CE4E|nr:hypothetical protein [Absiella sp. AM29-15]RGC52584.1 hypothetical protein DW761_05795 [Absiella sp. AM29-15]